MIDDWTVTYIYRTMGMWYWCIKRKEQKAYTMTQEGSGSKPGLYGNRDGQFLYTFPQCGILSEDFQHGIQVHCRAVNQAMALYFGQAEDL